MPCAFKDVSKIFIYVFSLHPVGQLSVNCFTSRKRSQGK